MKINNPPDVVKPDSSPALLLTLEEAAAVLRMSPRTVHSLAVAGKIKSKKIGRLRRFRPADLAEFANADAESIA